MSATDGAKKIAVFCVGDEHDARDIMFKHVVWTDGSFLFRQRISAFEYFQTEIEAINFFRCQILPVDADTRMNMYFEVRSI